jgi:transcriptional regulator GlxA family with amidase domain
MANSLRASRAREKNFRKGYAFGSFEPVTIANAVGYENAGFFGRLFKRKINLTPVQYRRRFGAMWRSLAGSVGMR